MEYSVVGAGTRIFILVLLILVLALGGLVWFDYLGLVDARRQLSPVFRLLGLGGMAGRGAALAAEDPEDPFLLEKERLAKEVEALAVRTEELDRRQAELTQREQEATQIQEQLEEKGKAVEDREKMLSDREEQIENRRVNLQQNSEYLLGMPPKNAVPILLAMDDMEVIDIFRMTEEKAKATGELSVVAYWLSLMPAERAAALQRKMSRKTGG